MVRKVGRRNPIVLVSRLDDGPSSVPAKMTRREGRRNPAVTAPKLDNNNVTGHEANGVARRAGRKNQIVLESDDAPGRVPDELARKEGRRNRNVTAPRLDNSPGPAPATMTLRGGKSPIVTAPRIDNATGHVPRAIVGMRYYTLFELKQLGIHRVPNRFHITQNVVNSVMMTKQDLDNGLEVTVRGSSRTDKIQDIKPLMAFQENYAKGHLVRVIRSHKTEGQYPPMMGFRYDGLYHVTETSHEKGIGGRGTSWSTLLVRLPDQIVPWDPIPEIDSCLCCLEDSIRRGGLRRSVNSAPDLTFRTRGF